MFTAWLIGFVLAFAGSMPMAGPTGVLVLTWGLDRRYDKAVAVALGAALPEAAYASLAFLGFSALLQRHGWVEPASRGLGVGILLLLGAFLLTRGGALAAAVAPAGAPAVATPATPIRAGVRGPVGAFGVGFGIAIFNPMFIANWSAVVATVHASGLYELHPDVALPFASGVALGVVSWFSLVLVLLARYGDRFKADSRGRLTRALGGVLVTLGLLFGARALVL